MAGTVAARSLAVASSLLATCVLEGPVVHGLRQPLRPSETFESLSHNVQALGQRLSEMELQEQQSLEGQKYQYEKQLSAMQRGNAAAETKNRKLHEELVELNHSIAEKRAHAKALQADIEAQREDAELLRQNLTTVIELANGTIRNATRNNQSLPVLRELDARDRRHRAAKEQQRRLAEIAEMKPLPVAALQTRAALAASPADGGSVWETEPAAPAAPDDGSLQVEQQGLPEAEHLVQSLDGSLKDLAGDYRSQQEELKAHFQQAFLKENERHERFQKKLEELQHTKAAVLNVSKRLDGAVELLEGDLARCLELGRSMRFFAQQLGIRPVPRPGSEDSAGGFPRVFADDNKGEVSHRQTRSAQSAQLEDDAGRPIHGHAASDGDADLKGEAADHKEAPAAAVEAPGAAAASERGEAHAAPAVEGAMADVVVGGAPANASGGGSDEATVVAALEAAETAAEAAAAAETPSEASSLAAAVETGASALTTAGREQKLKETKDKAKRAGAMALGSALADQVSELLR